MPQAAKRSGVKLAGRRGVSLPPPPPPPPPSEPAGFAPGKPEDGSGGVAGPTARGSESDSDDGGSGGGGGDGGFDSHAAPPSRRGAWIAVRDSVHRLAAMGFRRVPQQTAMPAVT